MRPLICACAIVLLAFIADAQTTPWIGRPEERPLLDFGRRVLEHGWNSPYTADDPDTVALFHFDEIVSPSRTDHAEFKNHAAGESADQPAIVHDRRPQDPASAPTKGKFGDGALNVRWEVPDGGMARVSLRPLAFGQSLTYEAWVQVSARLLAKPGDYAVFAGAHQPGLNVRSLEKPDEAILTGSVPDLRALLPGASNAAEGKVSMAPDRWYHVALTVQYRSVLEGSVVRVYFDGKEVGSRKVQGELWSLRDRPGHYSDWIGIGGFDLSSGPSRRAAHVFDGLIDEVRISHIAREFDRSRFGSGSLPSTVPWSMDTKTGRIQPVESTTSASLVLAIGKGSHPAQRMASEELVRYLGLLTGERLAIVDEGDPAYGEARFAFLIDNLTYPSSKWIANSKTITPTVPADPDGYVVKSTAINGKQIVALVGRRPRGCLFATYHYLERQCGLGFFEDGEYIPEFNGLPFAKIDVQEKPRFPVRTQTFGIGWRDHWRGHPWASPVEDEANSGSAIASRCARIAPRAFSPTATSASARLTCSTIHRRCRSL
jgi:hypothetical protein